MAYVKTNLLLILLFTRCDFDGWYRYMPIKYILFYCREFATICSIWIFNKTFFFRYSVETIRRKENARQKNAPNQFVVLVHPFSQQNQVWKTEWRNKQKRWNKVKEQKQKKKSLNSLFGPFIQSFETFNEIRMYS